jgi:hypothetical protein
LIRHGLPPYPDYHLPLSGTPSIYPPPLILLAGVPLSTLAFHAAAVVWCGLLTVFSAASLYVLGVRDPRCYIVALLSLPFLGAIAYGNPTPVIIFLVALAYRYRRNAVVSGLAVGAALAIKPFVLPLLLWRPSRRSGIAAATTLVLVLGGWAVVGFQGLTTYPQLLSRLSDDQASHGASLYALAVQLGAGARAALLVSLLAAALVLALGRRSFNSAVLASLVCSPIAWSAYFALLYIVVAAESRRFSWRWLVGLCYAPLVIHSPGPRPIWTLLLSIGAAVYICVAPPGMATRLLRRAPRFRRSPPRPSPSTVYR